MKIAHVCPFVGEQLGGSERYAVQIAQYQQASHDVVLLTTTSSWRKRGRNRTNGLEIIRHYAPAAIWGVTPLAILLRNVLKSKPDVVHIHSYLHFISFQATVARHLGDSPVLCHVHGGVGQPPYHETLTRRIAKHVFDSTLGSYVLHHSDLVGSVSLTDLETLASQYKVPPEVLLYLPNGVDTTLFRPISGDVETSDNGTRLLYVGDFERWKGINRLLRWIRRNCEKVDPLTFSFVGQGRLHTELELTRDYCSRHSSRIRVEILGMKRHAEIPEIMRASTALVLPSYWEGMPTVILEAMASGIPVLVTPVGDVPKIITHKDTGFMIDMNMDNFSAMVDLVVHDRALVKKVTANALRLVRNRYDIEKIAALVEDAYRTIVR
ncbi:MAG: glycosyltransferase family 4 protein [Candidatus Thorarchaeota archaeon]